MAIGLLGLAGIAGAGLGGGALINSATKTNYSDPSQMQAPTGKAANKMQLLQELIRRHNAGELDLPNEQVRALSKMAAQHGMKFEVESKPVRKLLFDAADTALFGLLPNEWRPHSIGQELHGESLADRTAGTLGSVGGGLLAGGLILKGGKMALGGIKGWAGKGSAATNAQRSYMNAQPGGILNQTPLLTANTAGLATSYGPFGPGQFAFSRG